MDNLLSFAFATANFRHGNDRAPRLSLNLEEFPRSPAVPPQIFNFFFRFHLGLIFILFSKRIPSTPFGSILAPSRPVYIFNNEPSYKRNKIAVALVTRYVTKLRNDSLVHGCKCNNNLAGTNQLLRSLPIYLRCFRIAEVYFGISRPRKLWKIYLFIFFFVLQFGWKVWFFFFDKFFLFFDGIIVEILSRIRNLSYFRIDVSSRNDYIVSFNNFRLNVSNKLKWVWFVR